MFSSSRLHVQGEARLRYGLVVCPGLCAYAVSRDHMAFDSKYVPALRGPRRPQTVLYALLSGTLVVRGGATVRGPALLAFPQVMLDGADGQRPTTFVTGGREFAAMIVMLDDALFGGPPLIDATEVRHLDLPPTMLEPIATAARALYSDGCDRERERAVRHVLDRWQAAGYLGNAPRLGFGFTAAAGRLWATVARAWGRTATPTLDEMSADAEVSPRQLRRDVRAFVAMLGIGQGMSWREDIVSLRLRLAVTLLSAPGATPAAVATAVGYGRLSSMGRAFQNGGIALPRVITPVLQANARAFEAWERDGGELPPLRELTPG